MPGLACRPASHPVRESLGCKPQFGYSHLSHQCGWIRSARSARACFRTIGIDGGTWTTDNDPSVGGNCNHGRIGQFASSADPNTANLPGVSDPAGQHFLLAAGCTYDDSLFYRKYSIPSGGEAHTNFLWISGSTFPPVLRSVRFRRSSSICSRLCASRMAFMNSCLDRSANYATNRWQIWLPRGITLDWVDAGTSPCKTSTGTWHHLTYYLQRVMPTGYQEIPRRSVRPPTATLACAL